MYFNNKILLTFEDVLNTYKSRAHGLRALVKYKVWFPIKASPELAGLIADLMGDGHLQGKPKWRLDYTSKNIFELKRFNNEVKNLFGVSGKIRDCTTNAYGTKNLGINNKPLARVLDLLGVPTGSKVLIEFNIPRWITNDRRCFGRFVNRLFSCEATVDLKYKFIEIKMHKCEKLIRNGILFFMDIKSNLQKHFNIISTEPFLDNSLSIRKDGVKTRPVRLKIKRKDSLNSFRKYIMFDDEKKMIRVNKICGIVKMVI